MPDGASLPDTAPDHAGPAPVATAAPPVLGVHASLSGRTWSWRVPADPSPSIPVASAPPHAPAPHASAPDPAFLAAIERRAAAISQRSNLPELVGRLLAARGVSPDAANAFLDPTLRALLPDPSCLRDMDLAADRLARAVRGSECVGIFGDYDVDGACAAALLATLFRSLGCTVHTHIPDREREGYGPNAPALSELAARGATLVVCVDCGTAAPEPLATLRGRADVVVLDHHRTDGAPPPVLATVNPNRLDCRSGLGTLCATAIAFLCAVATLRVLRRDPPPNDRSSLPDLMALLDLVALATICDVMPLSGLNRALVTQGLRVMGRRDRPGLRALLAAAGAREVPDAFTCGYALGPRINAGGRIAEADLGLRLLLAADDADAAALAARLDGVNRQRRTVEGDMMELAELRAADQLAAGHAVILVADSAWHPGVVGIVAGRLKERFNRPVLVAALLPDGIAKGSGRAPLGLDIGGPVIAARQNGLLLTGGGHHAAAGFSLRAADLPAFHAFLDERLFLARGYPVARALEVDALLGVPAADVALAGQLERLAPFGHGNPEPVLVLPRIRVLRAERIGRENNTLRLTVGGEGGGPRLKAMVFRAAEKPFADLLDRPGAPPLHLAGTLRAETWNDRTTPTFFVEDAALA